MGAQGMLLDDGRLHLQHGPIDILIGADGEPAAVQQAHEAALLRFRGLLQELVDELPALRAPVRGACPVYGVVAQRMWQAVYPYRAAYITPMAAVAGAVAQELAAAYQRPGVRRAWVNDGGDIALHLTAGERFRVGLFADLDQWPRALAARGLAVDGVFDVGHDSPVRGVATSGWKGRSFSLGIADSVTVLAATAAQADAAATIVGNAVDLPHAGIVRRPANTIRDDSDLGTIWVTVQVPPLTPAQAQAALAAGCTRALQLRAAGHIVSCVITCQGWAASTDGGPARFLPLDAAVPGRAQHLLQETA
ncbi:UPF0280 family protein [Ottowia pentelensis]|uniref:UPF0280 family protein n=1 Tax=Ottowia pentelensis TaxID=511108 RepID=A0ABV6PNS8_9BURK